MAPKVSFIIIAYNAAAHLDNILDDVKKQTFNHSLIEVILVDSNSTDNTAEKFYSFKENNDFSCCKIFDNPKKVLPSGWNIALDNAEGEIILRVDAHSRIPDDFIEKNIKNIENGEDIVGGQRITVFDNDSRWKAAWASVTVYCFSNLRR